MKAEIRRPKAERRPKSEGRRPKCWLSSYVPTDHPFRAPSGGVWIDAASRLGIVRGADARELGQILALPIDGLQRTVRLAAERRLRKLEKQTTGE
jgi:hypothetical protein